MWRRSLGVSLTVSLLMFVCGVIGWCLSTIINQQQGVLRFPEVCLLGTMLIAAVLLSGVVATQQTQKILSAKDVEAVLKKFPCKDCPRRSPGNPNNG